MLKRKHQLLREIAQPIVLVQRAETTLPSNEDPVPDQTFFPARESKEVIASREDRLKLYEEIVGLKKLGLCVDDIAKRMGKSSRTLYRWFRSEGLQPPRKPRRSTLDVYLPYLLQRWNEGCRNISQLWRELKAEGYHCSYRSLYKYLHRAPVPPPRPKHPPTARARCDPLLKYSPSPRQTMWMLLKPESLDEAEQKVIDDLYRRSPEIEQAAKLTREFQKIVRQRQVEELDHWIIEVKSSQIKVMKSFAYGLERDRSAIEAALGYEWSNGPVEARYIV